METSSFSVSGIMLGFGLVGVIAIIILLAVMPQRPDDANEIKKNIGIIAAVTGIITGIFGAAAYVYFTANTNLLLPFLLIMAFVNLFLSLLAVSVSTLNLTA